jgi:hypothetical protein
MELTLDEVEARLKRMTPEQRAKVDEIIKPLQAVTAWFPQPGPQTRALESKADELLYGGAVGGGKTDLIIGLASTRHERSVIFRAQSSDLDGLWDRLLTVITSKHQLSQSNSNKKQVRFLNRLVEGGHLDLPGSERSWMGRPHDLIAFDEAAQLDEMKVNFVLQWLRSTTPGQRKRVVFATNPPIPEIKDGVMTDTGVGDWLLRWFAPWTDDTFPNPAADGELRWCYMVQEGDRLVTIWVEGPGAYDPVKHEPVPNATQDDIDMGRVAVAKSRTFIRSLLKDNVYLRGTGYAEKLSTTPEPLKSMLLLGDFTIKGADHPMQVIPTQWVLEAQQRWHERQHEIKHMRPPQLVLAADIAQGGMDTSVLASLLATDYFEELLTKPGSDTPDGRSMVAFLLAHRRDRSLVVLDGGGGWAGATAEQLEDLHDISPELFIPSHAGVDWTPDMLFRYANMRTHIWWDFRLALDPKSGFEICLPPSARLRAQLTVPHFKHKGKLLYIESKDDIRSRLNGASTDEADAVLMGWHYRDDALAKHATYSPTFIDRHVHGITPEKLRQQQGMPIDMIDPLEGW